VTVSWSHPGGKLLEVGARSLKQAELLAILIGTGIRGRSALDIANDVLDHFGGIFAIYRHMTWYSPQKALNDLLRIRGLGQRKALRILAAVDIGYRVYRTIHHEQYCTARMRERPPVLFALPELRRCGCPPQTRLLTEMDDAALLAAIIAPGVRGHTAQDIARVLLERFGSIRGLFGRDMGDFLTVQGLNTVKIIRLAAGLEVARRIMRGLA